MSTPFKPGTYNSVSPYMMVNGVDKFIALMKSIFDAEELRRYERADGSIMHAEIRIDDSVLMLSEATDDYPATSYWLHVYVPDAVATYEKALSFGCEGLEAPTRKKGDPDLRSTFKDFSGNNWAVSTQQPA